MYYVYGYTVSKAVSESPSEMSPIFKKNINCFYIFCYNLVVYCIISYQISKLKFGIYLNYNINVLHPHPLPEKKFLVTDLTASI